MELTKDQAAAREVLLQWARAPDSTRHDPCFFCLGGAAGTGKTTLMHRLSIDLALASINVVWTATTGKAARRLAEIVGRARTLHSVLYESPDGDAQTLSFDTVAQPPPSGTVVVVDEASMITPKVYEDMGQWAQLGTRFILVGDPYQLPPIITKNEAKKYGPDFTVFEQHSGAQLSEVVRGTGAIIKVATDIRTLQKLPRATVDGYAFHSGMRIKQGVLEWLNDPDDHVLITWTNDLRMRANKLIRQRFGYAPDAYLMPGEGALFCRNGQGVLNGEIAVGELQDGEQLGELRTHWLNVPEGPRVRVSCTGRKEAMDGAPPWIENFSEYRAALYREHQDRYGLRAEEHRIAEPIPITWSYCLTAHKAQGSEYRRVTVILRDSDVRNRTFSQKTRIPGGELPFAIRWAYTAVTRAKERVDFYIGPE